VARRRRHQPRRRRLPRRRDRPPDRPLAEQDDAWRAWFDANAIEPITVRYEELADDPQAVVAGVLDRIGAGPAEIPEPPLRRQGDDRSARWVERARAEVPA